MAPKSSPAPKKRQTWRKENMMEAISAVKTKQMGFLKASKEYNVPKTTLRRLVADEGRPVEEVVAAKLGRKPIFPPELEDSLAEYILLMEAKLFGLTQNDIRSLAFQLAVKNSLPNSFSVIKETAGRDWLRLFLRRHPSLSFRQPTSTSVARARGFSKENEAVFFDMLEKEMTTYNFSPNNIYNVDETGISVVPAKMPKVLALKGRKQIRALASAERGSLITAILCMSAAGSFVPPMFIFPRKRDNPLLMKGAPPGSIHANHPSGWVQTNLFSKWFKHFLATVKPSESSPVLLILDGHTSHTRNIEIIELARNNHIHILSIPPHSSHKIQPLDKTFMGPLKKYLTEEIRCWAINNAKALTHFDIIELFGRSYMKTQTGEIAVKGFSSTGICPFNRNIFNDHDFLAAEEVEAPIDCMEGTVTSSLPTVQTSELSQSEHNSDVVEPISFEPSTSSGIRSSSYIMPQEISPIPVRIKKTSNRGRKTGKAELISSSSYKQALEESLKKTKGERHVKKRKPKLEKGTRKENVLKTKKKSQRVEENTSSESDDNIVLNDSPDLSPDRSNQEDAKFMLSPTSVHVLIFSSIDGIDASTIVEWTIFDTSNQNIDIFDASMF
ncbi:PREDICTED: uncharacterized protein LOC108364016 [Rhagoletis zephyria]|uniref:uncharacterized protein LOC108364016 n=1 Tax=Rhagoletis zephyria TaxID=28612 RepID=UPI0008117027|nr:PREDICTED: uncharacterized protein LOC108364016 [Rhagoletis zephyria]